MNIKLPTPKSFKSAIGKSSMKQMMLSLIATTISIALTFGTAAILDNRKQNAEKREMVMMILNDFSRSIDHIQDIDSSAVDAFEQQVSMLENPETYDPNATALLVLKLEKDNTPAMTVENIFSSNIETIHTLGNILFAEKVSEFYLTRQQFFDTFKTQIERAFPDEEDDIGTYDQLAEKDLQLIVGLCEGALGRLRFIMQQCMQLMEVSDDELADFAEARRDLEEESDNELEPVLESMRERRQRFEKAVKVGRQKLGK